MKLHAAFYILGGACIAIAMLQGQFVSFSSGGLIISGIWAYVIKMGAVLAIGGWFLELLHLTRKPKV